MISISNACAGVTKLVDVADLKSAGATRTGSIPVTGTNVKLLTSLNFP
jgi:hypothetical protein